MIPRRQWIQWIRRSLGLGLAVLWSATGLAAEIAVSGRVASPEGAPLASCSVELLDKATGFREGADLVRGERPDAVDRVETDRDGSYTVLAPAAGIWVLRAECAGRVAMAHQLLPLTEPVRVPPAVLRTGEPIEIRVVDPDGKPVPDAIVVVHPELSAAPWNEQALDGWRPEIRWARSDAEGRARFLEVDGEALTTQTYGSGFVFSRVDRVEGGTAELRLRSGIPVEITVEAEGEPPAGSLLVRLGRSRWPVRVLDGAGSFVFFALPDRESSIWIESESGLVSGSVLSLPADPPAKTLRLQRPRSIGGSVVDASSGAPISGAVVWRDSQPSQQTLTDAAGEWRLETGPYGSIRLRVEAAGFLPVTVKGAELEETQIRMEPGVSLAGTVVDSLDRPVADAEVLCSPARAPSVQQRVWSSTGGAFRCSKLPRRRDVVLEILRAGFVPASLRIQPQDLMRPARIRLRRADRVHGRIVTAGGEPVAGAAVFASPVLATQDPAMDVRRLTTEAETDRRGRFEFPHLPAGSYGLELAGAHRAPRVLDHFEVKPGVGEVDLGALSLGPEVRLEGRVLTPDGEPIGDARVAVAGSALSRPAVTATGQDGAFLLDGFPAGETVEVRVAHPEFQDAEVEELILPPQAPLEIVLSASAMLEGTVVDAEDLPIAAAKVELLPAVEPADPTVTVTSEEGAFVLRDLAPGSGWLEVNADGYLSQQVEVDIGTETALTVVLDRGWPAEGLVLGTDELPVAGATVTLREKTRDPSAQVSTSDRRGWFRVSGLRPGEHDASVRHPDYSELVETVQVPAPQSGLRFVLTPGARVAGNVFDPEGHPIEAAYVRLRSTEGTGRAYEASTDEEGTFELTAVARGGYRLLVEKEGYATGFYPGELSVEEAPVEDLVVQLDGGAKVQGRVLGLDSDELARLEVSAFHPTGERRTGRTEGNGYVVDRLRPGEWVLRASVEGSDRTLQRSLTLTSEARVRELDLEFERGPRLSGEIVVDGAPLEGARILLQSGEPSTPTYRTTSDSAGRFGLGVSRPGEYLLTVLDRAGVIRHREQLELTSDLHRSIVQGTGSLSGRLLRREFGAPARGARVILRRVADGVPLVMRMTETGPEGRFAFDQLAAGDYQIGVEGFAGPPPAVRVDAGVHEHLGDLEIEE